MDEAEQLCDRLAVMDGGTFAAEGAPSELIASYSTVKCSSSDSATPTPTRRHRGASGRVGGALRGAPDRLLLYTDDGESALTEVHRLGLAPDSTLIRRSTLEDVFLRLTGGPWSTEPARRR